MINFFQKYYPLKSPHPGRQTEARRGSRGFTLIELIVAIAIFMVAAVAISAILINIFKAQRKAKIEQRVQAAGRLAMEILTQQIRDNTIDYAGYGGSIPSAALTYDGGYESTLRLRDPSDNPITIGQAEVESWISENVKVETLSFFIVPTQDPFLFGGPDEQPRVTVLLIVADRDAVKVEEQAFLRLQTTISTRIYRR